MCYCLALHAVPSTHNIFVSHTYIHTGRFKTGQTSNGLAPQKSYSTNINNSTGKSAFSFNKWSIRPLKGPTLTLAWIWRLHQSHSSTARHPSRIENCWVGGQWHHRIWNVSFAPLFLLQILAKETTCRSNLLGKFTFISGAVHSGHHFWHWFVPICHSN